jgi:hypothetical protein
MFLESRNRYSDCCVSAGTSCSSAKLTSITDLADASHSEADPESSESVQVEMYLGLDTRDSWRAGEKDQSTYADIKHICIEAEPLVRE